MTVDHRTRRPPDRIVAPALALQAIRRWAGKIASASRPEVVAVAVGIMTVGVAGCGVAGQMTAATSTTNAAMPSRGPTVPAPGGSTSPPAAAGGVPADMLNPAVTQATIASTICVPGYTRTIRPPAAVTNRIKNQQIAAYGYGNVTPGSFEEDHVIPLEVGGAAAAPANLYPEPLAIAGQDDQLENDLHRKVCSGTTTLADAQAQVLAAKTAHGYRRSMSAALTASTVTVNGLSR